MASLKKLNDADLLVKLVKNVPAKKLPDTIASVILFMDILRERLLRGTGDLDAQPSHVYPCRTASGPQRQVASSSISRTASLRIPRPKNANSIIILGADQKDNRHARTAIKNAWRCAKTEIRNNSKSIALIVDAFGD